ncbi:squalene epoxidase-domain-containing protein [Bombardia bombarda]|uniref:Squalene monooxygenase n=1 Tax=Bombardia bombarda TaxID=252184 RepID=A0AA39WGC4_9PEZI|nr:squalene epoxidase-domain-containing protein [Bombardia bombarda]
MSSPFTDVDADVLVIGAGVAGCAIATAFSRQQKSVILVERSLKQPDRIVGELLQPGGVQALEKLGLESCLEGIDASLLRGFPPLWFCNKPDTGRSFHHSRFVAKLRDAVEREPNTRLVEATASEILSDKRTGAVVGARCIGSDKVVYEFHAHLTVLANGPFSNFRSQFLPHQPITSQSRLWALALSDVDLPFPETAHAIEAISGTVSIYQIATREARILINIPHKVQRDLVIDPGAEDAKEGAVRSYIRANILPAIPITLQQSLANALETGRLRSMPTKWMPSVMNQTPGLVVLGDALEMRNPVTGAGMMVALKDVLLLTRLFESVPLDDADAVLGVLRSFHWKRKVHSALLNIFAQAMYDIFVSERLEIIQGGYIRFIQEGPRYFAEPAAILGGTMEDPFLALFYVFFIALYSIWLHLRASGLCVFPLRCSSASWCFGGLWASLSADPGGDEGMTAPEAAAEDTQRLCAASADGHRGHHCVGHLCCTRRHPCPWLELCFRHSLGIVDGKDIRWVGTCVVDTAVV